jgi:hypothetical protein
MTQGFRNRGSMTHAAEAIDPGICSHFVLDTLFHLRYTLVHPGPTGGALARRRKSGAGSGPAAGLASLLAGGPWQPCAGPSPPKSTACEVPSGSSIPPSTSSRAAHRATLDHPPSSQRKLRAYRCWLFNRHIVPADVTTSFSSGPVLSRPPRSGKARRFTQSRSPGPILGSSPGR